MPSTHVAIPTLSTLGWVNTLEHKVDQIFSYFVTSQYSQSMLYQGKVSSLAYLVTEYAHDPDLLKREVGDAIGRLFGRYFERVQYNVEIDDHELEATSKYSIRIKCYITESGQEYDIAREVKILKSRIVRVESL